MSQILLVTLNARYIHTSFGLRYLQANLGELADQSSILEMGIKHNPIDVVDAILAREPRIVGLGVYIWNATQSLQVATLLKRIRPDVKLVIGGPEVSYETYDQEIARIADVVITGEADLVFPEVCLKLLKGQPTEHIIHAQPPKMEEVALPYHLYSDTDLSQRVLYVEASRGCPFRCEFCLSSLDIPVRRPETETFMAAMDDLLARGARHFKFVDRTFNLNVKLGKEILEFFLDRYTPGMFLHFEMVPDRLPEALRAAIKRFPPGVLQFEVGVQTFNKAVAERIQLRRDFVKLADNLSFLQDETGVHVHADLIAGLPGEDLASFAAGFDRLYAMRPHEIQVGILKRLRGTPIVRHDDSFAMRYSPFPPYEILSNDSLDHGSVQELRRFSKLWDRVGNSGHFRETLRLMWQEDSPFEAFMGWTRWVYREAGQVYGLGLDRLTRYLFDYLTQVKGMEPDQVGAALAQDPVKLGRKVPGFLKPYTHARRQARHQNE
jgi:radical SAM superfamily enzyme YgiQ (UPF0313 family)